jgi:hypothetical protein
MLNRKSKADIILKYSNIEDVISLYHYVTVHDSRIFERNILFSSIMTTSSERRRIATQMTKEHIIWKYQAHIDYRKQCRRYAQRRMAWEKQLVKATLQISEICWSTGIAAVKGLLSIPLDISRDCQELVETDDIGCIDRVSSGATN